MGFDKVSNFLNFVHRTTKEVLVIEMPPRKSAITTKKISGIAKQNKAFIPLPTQFASKGDRKVRSAVENRVNKRNQLLRDVLAPSFNEDEEDEEVLLIVTFWFNLKGY